MPGSQAQPITVTKAQRTILTQMIRRQTAPQRLVRRAHIILLAAAGQENRMAPGQPERREFEYIRHGTQRMIIHVEEATGQVISPSIGETRTEADFTAHIRQTIATDPDGAWVFVLDQWNTHPSESLGRLVAEPCGITDDLGVKGNRVSCSRWPVERPF